MPEGWSRYLLSLWGLRLPSDKYVVFGYQITIVLQANHRNTIYLGENLKIPQCALIFCHGACEYLLVRNKLQNQGKFCCFMHGYKILIQILKSEKQFSSVTQKWIITNWITGVFAVIELDDVLNLIIMQFQFRQNMNRN